jgi:hypothetical protein
VTVIKSGYLQKRSQKSRNDYKRRFFVLDSQVRERWWRRLGGWLVVVASGGGG